MGVRGQTLERWPQSRSFDEVTVDGHTIGIKVTGTENDPLTIRQLDATHWEFLSEVDQGSATVVPTMAPMAAVLKHQAQHGATAQERADAERQLAALPRMQTEMDQQRASTLAMFEQQLREAKTAEEKEGLRRAIAQLQGTPALKGQSRALWTRLSNACK